MKNHLIQGFCHLFISLFCFLLIAGCSHTVQGMRQDIHEATDSDDQQVTVVKKTTVVKYQPAPSSSLPSSPPPLQTPSQ